MQEMKSLGIIPARYASSRLPGKPLADLVGKPMIQHVYERASSLFDHLLVATDDQRIVEAVNAFGGQVLLTDSAHPTGTNRCLEAYQLWSTTHGAVDVIVNIQGDEPLVDVGDLKALLGLFAQAECQIGTLVKAIDTEAELNNRSGCFAVISEARAEALYFSRQLMPFLRDIPRRQWLAKHRFYKHIGLYAYRPEALARFAALPLSPLEKAEALEQNRWLEDGGRIKLAFAEKESLSVDTPEDLAAVRALMQGGR